MHLKPTAWYSKPSVIVAIVTNYDYCSRCGVLGFFHLKNGFLTFVLEGREGKEGGEGNNYTR